MSEPAEERLPSTLPATPTYCVLVVDESLPAGWAANAAAVIGLTVGQRHPVLVGEPLVDASGFPHPGLIPLGIAVLAASRDALSAIRRKGLEAGCDVVDFPEQGQRTTDYRALREAVALAAPQTLRYVGVALVGDRKAIRRIVGNLGLLK